MSKETMYGLLGLLVGALIMMFISGYVINNNHTGMMQMMGIRVGGYSITTDTTMSHDESMTMEQMTEGLKNKTGDSFDSAFIDAMIAHHQGAIEMAQEAKVKAKHEEIKKMADDIISAQSNEIKMMQDWQKMWGY